MKKKFLILFLSCTVISEIRAQTSAKSVYGEVGGPGIISANYDIRFTKTENGLGGRIGIGGFADADFTSLSVPFGLNYLVGKNGKNYFEFGFGGAYLNRVRDFFGNNNSSNFLGHFTMGYRLQPKNGGFLFRAALTPVFGNSFFIPYYGSLSFGYKLK